MLTSDGKEPEGQALTFKEGKKGGVQITNSHQGEIIAIRIDTELFRRSCSRNKHWNDFKNLIVEVTTICSSYEKRELVLLNGGVISEKMPMPSKCRAEDAAVAM
jgi:hypothetical protein